MLTDRRQINKLAILFMLTYMVSYMTRINYGAIVAAMETATGITGTQLSLALTGSFITYGIGQLISGMAGDMFSPKKLVSIGLIVTVIMNSLIPLCTNEYQMLAIWCVNGFAQSFMWPPIVKLMTGLLSSDDYNRVMVKVQIGSSMGTVIIYLLAPVLISMLSWKAVFFVCAAIGALMIVGWNVFGLDTPVGKKAIENTEHKKEKIPRSLIFALIMVMLAIIVMGMLRDGVQTWMPSYIRDTYELDDAISILTGVVLPIVGVICFNAASILFRTKIKNPILCATLFFAIAGATSAVIVLTTGMNAFVSVAFFSILSGCMHGVNMMLICTVPRFFKKGGKVSTVSGVLNACTYVGSALSTYGIAFLAENSGWTTTLSILLILAVAGAILSVIASFPWKKSFNDEQLD